jgi:hypothetical protein
MKSNHAYPPANLRDALARVHGDRGGHNQSSNHNRSRGDHALTLQVVRRTQTPAIFGADRLIAAGAEYRQRDGPTLIVLPAQQGGPAYSKSRICLRRVNASEL